MPMPPPTSSGSRVAPVMPERPTRKTNFFQRSTSTVSVSEMSTPACLAASAKAASFSSGLPSTRPQRICAKSLVWLTVPGADITLRDIRHAARHVVAAEDRLQSLDRVDAVLQRDDAGRGGDDRADELAGLLGIPQLDREQHDVDGRHRLRIVGRRDLGQRQVALRAFDLQSAVAQRRQVGAAREEDDVVPGRREPPTEITADGPGRHRRIAGGFPRALSRFPARACPGLASRGLRLAEANASNTNPSRQSAGRRAS